MDIFILVNWAIYLIAGSVIGGAIGLAIDMLGLFINKSKIKFIPMVTNFIDISIEILMRFLSLPLALFIIYWVDMFIPACSMKSIEGFLIFILKLTIIIIILITFIKLKVPSVGKPNDMERANTRGICIIGSLLMTVYFCYTNQSAVKHTLSLYAKIFGFHI